MARTSSLHHVREATYSPRVYEIGAVSSVSEMDWNPSGRQFVFTFDLSLVGRSQCCKNAFEDRETRPREPKHAQGRLNPR